MMVSVKKEEKKMVAMEKGHLTTRKNGNEMNSKMKQKKVDKEAIALALYAHAIKYRMATQRLGKETPLTQLKLDPRENDGYDQVSGRGVLVLHKLRETLGAEVFDAALDQFGKGNAGREVTTADFRAHLEKVTGKSLEAFFSSNSRSPY